MPIRIGRGGPFLVVDRLSDTVAQIDDDGDSWWSSANRNGVGVAIAGAAAALSASVAIANGFNRPADEIIPYQPSDVGSYSVPYGQRARQTTLFVRWSQGDELPTAAVPVLEEGEWLPRPYQTPPKTQLWSGEDDLPVVSAFEDDSGWRQQAYEAAKFIRVWTGDDDLPFTAAPALDDGDWALPASRAVVPPLVQVWNERDELPVSTVFEEGEWLSLLAAPGVKVQQPWLGDDDLPVSAAAQPALDDAWQSQYVIQQAPRLVPVWIVEDELPRTTVFEDDGWQQPATVIPRVQGLAWVDDGLPVTPAATIVEEEYWLVLERSKDAIRAQAFSSTDELLPSVVDETYWYQSPWQRVPIVVLVVVDEQIVPQPAPISVDEAYWLTFPSSPDLWKLHRLELIEDDFPKLSQAFGLGRITRPQVDQTDARPAQTGGSRSAETEGPRPAQAGGKRPCRRN